LAYCCKKNILFTSTPFDEVSADFLEELDVPLFKIPSGEITNLPFLRHVAKKKRPLVVSTGMSTLEEVKEAVDVILSEGNEQLALMHCVSSYPAQPVEINLRAMETLRKTFDVPVGFSDHTSGIEVALAAVALGACIIEKHFTLDKNLPGPDHKMSLMPLELGAMIRGIRTVEMALGKSDKKPSENELKVAAVIRKSLVASRHIAAGTSLRQDMVAIRRPGTGITPRMIDQVLGRRAARDIPASTLITWEMLR
jgi:N-acetylneuraminate synthase/N,N'-diacetyllegionaminate synthase